MALRMQADKRYSESMDSIIAGSDILQKDIAAYKSGDLMNMIGHVAGNYDYSKDYWKLKLDGTLEAEYDKNGKLITDLNVEYLDERGELQTRLHIKDDTGSGSESIARYVGLERASQILGNCLFDADLYDTQTLQDVLPYSKEQIARIERSGIIPIGVSDKEKYRLVGEALLKKYGMEKQDNNWTGKEKFSLAMSDEKI